MAQKVYVVEGRKFRTESDYALAKRDKAIIDKLRKETDFGSRTELEALRETLQRGGYQFRTLLGQDFRDEVEERLKKALPSGDSRQKRGGTVSGRRESSGGQAPSRGGPFSGRKTSQGKPASGGRTDKKISRGQKREEERWQADDPELEEIVRQELKKRERYRKIVLLACSAVAVCCLGYFGVYSYYDYRTQSAYDEMNELKDKPLIGIPALPAVDSGPLYTLDGEAEPKEVLDEYKNLLLTNRKLIGWVQIDGTNIDYPVMQTTDNEYYLDHNTKQEYDKNGTIFMDKDCDVLKPSTNFILYGHHMRSGKMFGQLDKYQDKSFYEEHPCINFDTIYEKGTYQVMYVFRSRVYKETEIVFKYYQFIDANGEKEFDSTMEEMAALSLYDTGVTAEYGDQLLTLSTCDYQETDGRFVVVAKKITEE